MTLQARTLAREAWPEAVRIVFGMPIRTGSVCILSVLLAYAIPDPDGGAAVLLQVGRELLLPVLSAVLVMAVHRAVLLHETADGSPFSVPHGFGRFVLWSLLLTALSLPMSLIPRDADMPVSWGVVGLAGVVVSVVLSVRLALLFPAISVGKIGAKAGAEAGAAWADARGHGWLIFRAFLLASLPLLVMLLVLGGFAAARDADVRAAVPWQPVWAMLGSLLLDVVLAVVAARCYQALANELVRPPA